jgi:hypothetical protein
VLQTSVKGQLVATSAAFDGPTDLLNTVGLRRARIGWLWLWKKMWDIDRRVRLKDAFASIHQKVTRRYGIMASNKDVSTLEGGSRVDFI